MLLEKGKHFFFPVRLSAPPCRARPAQPNANNERAEAGRGRTAGGGTAGRGGNVGL